MALDIKVNGAWKQCNQPYVNVNGTWKLCNQAYINVNGVWKPVLLVTVTKTRTKTRTVTIDMPLENNTRTLQVTLRNVKVGSTVTVTGDVYIGYYTNPGRDSTRIYTYFKKCSDWGKETVTRTGGTYTHKSKATSSTVKVERALSGAGWEKGIKNNRVTYTESYTETYTETYYP